MKDPLALRHRCHQRWADLAPNGRGRHCAECDTTVVDLSRLTRKAALAKVASGACVRVVRDGSGAAVFRPEPSAKAGLVVAAALLGGCAGSPDPAPTTPEVPPAAAAPALEPVAVVPGGVAVADLADLAELEGSLRAWRAEDGPTPEQIALTEAKRRRAHGTAAGPPGSPLPQHPHGQPQVVMLESLGVPW